MASRRRPRWRPRTRALRRGLRSALLAFAALAAVSPLGCEQPAAPAPPLQPLDRGTFFVSVRETLEGETPTPNITEYLITKNMLLHGFHAVPDSARARFVIEGTVDCTYYKDLTFEYGGQKQHLEHQYNAVCALTLTDRQAQASGDSTAVAEEFIDIPQLINGRLDREDARRDIRRYAATKLAERVVNGKMFVVPEVQGNIRALGDPLDPRTFNAIVENLVQIGAPAVPHLLMTLLDERPVRIGGGGSYPGLEEWNMDDLKYYHVADLALSEILQRDSGLALDSTEKYLKKVITAWYWVWEDVQNLPADYRTAPEQRRRTTPAIVTPDSGSAGVVDLPPPVARPVPPRSEPPATPPRSEGEGGGGVAPASAAEDRPPGHAGEDRPPTSRPGGSP